MHKASSELPVRLPKDPFGYIAFWQFLTFVMLLMIVWMNELRDMPALLFQTEPEPMNLFRGCILSAGVFITAIVIIGNTYLQQRRALAALITVCAACHKVRVNQQEWKQMEAFVSERSLLTFSHGLCPGCLEKELTKIDQHFAPDKAGPEPAP